jgi:hypothetical protein
MQALSSVRGRQLDRVGIGERGSAGKVAAV